MVRWPILLLTPPVLRLNAKVPALDPLFDWPPRLAQGFVELTELALSPFQLPVSEAAATVSAVLDPKNWVGLEK
jgi:hypothetical protein